eukprot:3992416-Pleurochrysis_carterae.AAC.1
MNYHIAKAIASLRPVDASLPHAPPADESNRLPIPIAVATPLPNTQPPPASIELPDTDTVVPPVTTRDDRENDSHHFQRGLGSYSLRSSALL